MTDTFYMHYQFNLSSPKYWSVNLPFLCVRCGKCCTLRSVLSAGSMLTGNPSEEQISEANKKLQPYIEEYNRKIHEDKDIGEEYYEKTKCPFLSSDNFCEIYKYRPVGCQLYPKTDFGMDTEEGFCGPLDRFKRLRTALLRRQECYIGNDFFLKDGDGWDYSERVGVKPVQMTKRRYEWVVSKLLKAGITSDELELFKLLNKEVV